MYSKKIQEHNAGLHNRTMGRTDEVKNSHGAFVFAIDQLKKLRRFLILGTEGGSYYSEEKALTVSAATNIIDMIKKNGKIVVDEILAISTGGRCPRNNTCVFALALCIKFGNDLVRHAAYEIIKRVCRTGTDLFMLCEDLKVLDKGWSRGLRNGIAQFYLDRDPSGLAYQLIKYRQRNGWSHTDVLRLSHVKPEDPEYNNLFRWVVGKELLAKKHPLVKAFEEVQALGTIDITRTVNLILENNLPREALPTELLNQKRIWEALLPGMPPHALLRNLGKMANIGLMQSNFDAPVKLAVAKLTDRESIKKSKLHPITILNALKVYAQGHGEKGDLTWYPVQAIKDALNEAFYLGFDNVEPTNKNFFIGVDVSPSMFNMKHSKVNNMAICAAEAAMAMSMAIARTEKSHEIHGFAGTRQITARGYGLNSMTPINISARSTLEQSLTEAARCAQSWGGTDCSLPMKYALAKKLPVDVFVIITDNETNQGVKPTAALNEFRQKTGRNAKLIVLATSVNPYTVADPTDPGQMDIVGFDTNVPNIIRSFVMDEF